MTQTQKYLVSGMHCASCVYFIENILSKEKGVNEVRVNLTDNTARVSFDEQTTDINVLNKKIDKAGYKLVEITPQATKERGGGMTNGAPAMNHSVELSSFNSRLGLVLVGFSFLMLAYDGAHSLGLVPSLESISPAIYETIHHFMPIAATYMLVSQGTVYVRAIWNFMRSGHANMDTLTGMGVVTAFLFSFVVTALDAQLSGTLDTSRNFYDVVIILIGLINLGHTIETRAKQKTSEAVRKLVELGSKSALVFRDSTFIEVDANEVKKGDTVAVKAGMNVPVDGVISTGTVELDESSLTGEAMPVVKKVGDTVYAGTTITSGYVELTVTGVGADSKLGQIARIVEDAMTSRAPIQRLADIVSNHFTKVALVIASLSLIGWTIYAFLTGDFALGIKLGITGFVSVLIVACPCSLGLATPLAIARGVGEAAKHGILFKNAESIQKLKSVTAIIFDKTGTLTTGRFGVAEFAILSPDYTKAKVLPLLFALEDKSNHPVAVSITTYIASENKMLPKPNVESFETHGSNGISGIVAGTKYYIGGHRLVEKILKKVHGLETEGTVVYMFTEKELIARLTLADEIKPEAPEMLRRLRKLGIATLLSTGDRSEVAARVGAALGFAEREVYSQQLPEDKLKLVEELHKQGKKVAMFGDGINDSPALAKADIGVAMGTGADIALETADVTLLGGDLSKLIIMIQLSKDTFAKIAQNLWWAFSYNIVMIPLATGIFFPFLGWTLSPAIDGAAMAFSSLSVVFNSLRIGTKN